MQKADSVARKKVRDEGAKKVTIQLLIDKHKARTFVMRRFFVERGGETPLHEHSWEHEVYILKGYGIVTDGKVKHKIGPNTVVYVPPNQKHQFKNIGRSTFSFLCLIPK